jgi:hypothetical protein
LIKYILLLSYIFSPPFLTFLNGFHFSNFIHKYMIKALWSYWPFTLSLSPSPLCELPPPKVLLFYTLIILSFSSRFCIKETTCNICLSPSGSVSFYTLYCKWHNSIFLNVWTMFHCVYVPHFLNSFFSWWVPKVIP